MDTRPLHIFLVSFVGQGHVNPLLRLGKRLASKGLLVTFSTSKTIGKQMRKTNSIAHHPTPVASGFIRFEFFDDEWDENDPRRQDLDLYLPQLELVGRKFLHSSLKRNAEENRPVTCLVNNPFIPWVSDVAGELGLPSALLWVQSAACFSCYYHYYHNLANFPSETDPETVVQLPALPLLKYDEVPSFLYPTTPYPFLRRAILSQYGNLSKPFCVLMDTFEALEPETIRHVSKFASIKSVGPLFRDTKSTASVVRGDFIKADDCIEWLDSKPTASIVYVSFGSVVYLPQEQVSEMAHGLLDSGLNFLWVLRPPHKDSGLAPQVLPEGFTEKAGDRGKVVQWSPQEKVLSHPSTACFVTHCGWNSTMESLTSGVPVGAFPQWGDQVTNAKFIVDVFKTGVLISRGEAENKIIPRDEINRRLVEATVGEKAEDMRRNAAKWKKAAEEAVAEGGSSDTNLQDFVEEVTRMNVGFMRSESAFTPKDDAKIVETVREEVNEAKQNSVLPALAPAVDTR